MLVEAVHDPEYFTAVYPPASGSLLGSAISSSESSLAAKALQAFVVRTIRAPELVLNDSDFSVQVHHSNKNIRSCFNANIWSNTNRNRTISYMDIKLIEEKTSPELIQAIQEELLEGERKDKIEIVEYYTIYCVVRVLTSIHYGGFTYRSLRIRNWRIHQTIRQNTPTVYYWRNDAKHARVG
ncbi:hypothetical protein [Paenibacillus ginsengarvi]|uniref:hypothetical protein n=1 Tax=Paenibacillus ginsengarvi TaxID=400777 RepID=UPI0011C47B20|nr:hypothetical protein [Paenibacillus ginsengarvi]